MEMSNTSLGIYFVVPLNTSPKLPSRKSFVFFILMEKSSLMTPSRIMHSQRLVLIVRNYARILVMITTCVTRNCKANWTRGPISSSERWDAKKENKAKVACLSKNCIDVRHWIFIHWIFRIKSVLNFIVSVKRLRSRLLSYTNVSLILRSTLFLYCNANISLKWFRFSIN